MREDEKRIAKTVSSSKGAYQLYLRILELSCHCPAPPRDKRTPAVACDSRFRMLVARTAAR